jgi:hypothetical protein
MKLNKWINYIYKLPFLGALVTLPFVDVPSFLPKRRLSIQTIQIRRSKNVI